VTALGEEAFNEIELVEADLTLPETIYEAIKGCTYVIHVASPINPQEFQKYEDYVNPAKEGTLAVLSGCTMHKIKKLIVTSSCLTIVGLL